MASEEKWYFTKEQLDNTPSRQCGFDAYKELFYRQQAANFIQDMGQRLRVTQLCINTATVYMHRFYVFHSFTHFPWHSIAAAALFLSAKVEEQPRKLEHVIRIHNLCKNSRDTALDVQSERYQAQSQDLVFNENILLQTLGFDVAIDHPHAHVVRCCHLVRASKDLAQTSYFMASTSLHLTTMCLQYKPTVVACFCIHLACKWSNWEIPLSNEKKEWFSYVDPTVTAELLQQLTEEFLVIFERCPSRLKEKIMAIGDGASMCRSSTQTASPFDTEPRKLHPPTDMKDAHHRLHYHEKANVEDPHKHRSSRPPHESSSSSQQQREREYREKKERERMAQHSGGKPPIPHPNASSTKPPSVPHAHHRPPVDPKMKPHSRPPSMGHPPPIPGRSDHRDLLKEATRDVGIRDSSHPPRLASDINDSVVGKESHNRDMHARSESKDLDKRGYPVKPNASDSNSVQQEHYSSDKRSRPSVPDPKIMQPHKHDSGRHEQKAPYKSDNDVRKHWYDNKNMYDKNNVHMKPPMNATSKMKSPFAPEASKSVPKPVKTESHNGSSSSTSSSNGGYGLPLVDDSVKPEPKDEPYYPPVKKPSMFSPEKSPPRKPPVTINKRPTMESSLQSIPTPISPLESFGSSKNRQRTGSSSSSEPELRPVMKKIDQVEGFENILRDSTIGIKPQVPDIVADQPEASVQQNITSKDVKTADAPVSHLSSSSSSSVPLSQPLVNGIETNPALIRNLLKETPSVPHLPTITNTVAPEESAVVAPVVVAESKEKEHHHKDRKKKNKEKHKHKDKDKSRGDKERKKKYKDKDKEKHKSKNKDKEKPEEIPTPIKITISKDKIQPPDTPSVGLKIKIPKDRIKTDVIGEASSSAPTPAPGIKIKIPKDVISMGSESKKRERDRGTPSEAPPTKVHKSSYSKQHSDKQNGRSSFGKVAQLGDGDTSSHRLAESKYTNKGAPT